MTRFPRFIHWFLYFFLLIKPLQSANNFIDQQDDAPIFQGEVAPSMIRHIALECPGRIVDFKIDPEGQIVKKNDIILVYEMMKMQQNLRAAEDGFVILTCAIGDILSNDLSVGTLWDRAPLPPQPAMMDILPPPQPLEEIPAPHEPVLDVIPESQHLIIEDISPPPLPNTIHEDALPEPSPLFVVEDNLNMMEESGEKSVVTPPLTEDSLMESTETYTLIPRQHLPKILETEHPVKKTHQAKQKQPTLQRVDIMTKGSDPKAPPPPSYQGGRTDVPDTHSFNTTPNKSIRHPMEEIADVKMTKTVSFLNIVKTSSINTHVDTVIQRFERAYSLHTKLSQAEIMECLDVKTKVASLAPSLMITRTFPKGIQEWTSFIENLFVLNIMALSGFSHKLPQILGRFLKQWMKKTLKISLMTSRKT